MHMEIKDLKERAREVRRKYAKLEKIRYGHEWSGKDLAIGFVGDVGDLMKLVMAKEGIRDIEEMDEKFEHELSDCLWSIMILADKYGVDLEYSFLRTMDELEKRIDSQNKREKK